MRRAPTLLGGVLALAALSANAPAGDGPATLSAEDRADMAWFDSLGYPRVAGRPFVQVRRGHEPDVSGFVLEETDAKIRLLGLDLAEWEFAKNEPGAPEDRRIAIERPDPWALGEQWLSAGPAPYGTLADWRTQIEWDGLVCARTQAFVFAWGLAQQPPSPTDNGTLPRLFSHVRTMVPLRWRLSDVPAHPLRVRIASELPMAEFERCKAAPTAAGQMLPRTRAERLAALRLFAGRFPEAPEASEARRLAGVFERMAREDEEHAKTAKPLDELTGDARLAELVYGLRDQRTDGPRVGADIGPITSGPYAELVRLGTAAVPALIAALRDDGWTDCAGRHGGATEIVTVGDLALRALEEIAAREFDPAPSPFPAPPRTRTCRPAIDAWWREVQRDGERAVMARLVASPDWRGPSAAAAFAKRFPDAEGLAVLVKEARGTRYPEGRARFVEAAASIPGEVPVEFLLEELCDETGFDPRIAAARGLVSRRTGEAVAAMLGEWRLRRDGGGPPPAKDGCGMPRDEVTPAAAFLAEAATPESIRGLGEKLSERPAKVRVAVVGLLAHALGLDWTWRSRYVYGPAQLDPRAIGDVCDVLAASLGDRAVVSSRVESPSGDVGAGVLVRDVAAAALARCKGWNGPALASTSIARERAVATVSNAWHAHSGSPLPVPDLPVVASLPDADVCPILDAYVASHDAAATKSLEGLEARGLAALAPIESYLARGVPRSSADDLRAVAGRLAFVVREVAVDPASAEVPSKIRAGLDGLPGRTLTVPAIVALALDAVDEAKRAKSRISLTFERPGDGTGVAVIVRVDAPNNGVDDGWVAPLLLLRGGRPVRCAWTEATFPDLPDQIVLFRDALDEGLASSPEERVLIQVVAK
jgi:hypothetical protein